MKTKTALPAKISLLLSSIESYIHASASYSRAGQHEAWLEQTGRLVEQLGDEMPMAHRFFYMRTCASAFRSMERYQDAIQTGEDFIRWVRASDQLHPHKQRMIIEMQGLVLLPCYHKLGERQKIEAILKDAEETLDRYHAEWESVISSITDESQATRQRLNATYQKIESFPIGVDSYPAEASVAEIREWLDKKYRTGISYAMHNLAAGCTQIGEGEIAIRLFKRVIEHDEKRDIHRVNGNVNMWLAALMLSVRNDRNASLEYLKGAATDRRWAAAGWIKKRFEMDAAFESVRNDEEFLAVVMTFGVNGIL